MITLEEYKEYLINFFRYAIDNNDKSKKERIDRLSKFYPDSYLLKIINDTYNFIKDIFAAKEHEYCIFDADEELSTSIDLLITGGGYADTIYIDSKKRNISEYILRQVFGNYICIELRNFYTTYDASNNSIEVIYGNYLYIQGFPENMDKIKNKLFGETKKKGLNITI